MTVTAMEDGGSVGLLEDNAAKRKERLAALKRKLQTKDGAETGNREGEEEEECLPTPVFRSYKPQAPELQESAFDQADPHLIEEKIQVEIEGESQSDRRGREKDFNSLTELPTTFPSEIGIQIML